MQMLRMLDVDALDVPEQIPHGDMPGDGVTIGQDNIERAKTVLSAIQGTLERRLEESTGGRVVIGVCGGSGSGKTVMASVLGYALNRAGIGAYIMSGDNYPRRIPAANDAERLRLFRMGGLRGLLASGEYSDEKAVVLRELWQADADAEPETARKLPWMQTYQQAGAQALSGYLGTPEEIDFDEVNDIIARFKRGERHIPLKRMGREETAIWYETVDFTTTRVMVIEWTHANSDFLKGVDIPIYLNSTPMQTLEHRRLRNRDAQTDSAFTTMVLNIEQRKLDSQAWKAQVILSREGKKITYSAYRRETE